MFTGIIGEIGKVVVASARGEGTDLVVEAPASSRSLHPGDSVSVNGVCQTVESVTGDRFAVVAVEETLKKTTLGGLKPADAVNLELAMKLGDRLGGHMVSGHVDGVGRVLTIQRLSTSHVFGIEVPEGFERYIIPVGSIAVDGVSLTVAAIQGRVMTVSIIPHTLQNTIFSGYTPGSEVNLEFDLIGKYVERLLAPRSNAGEGETISWDRLREWGYGET